MKKRIQLQAKEFPSLVCLKILWNFINFTHCFSFQRHTHKSKMLWILFLPSAADCVPCWEWHHNLGPAHQRWSRQGAADHHHCPGGRVPQRPPPPGQAREWKGLLCQIWISLYLCWCCCCCIQGVFTFNKLLTCWAFSCYNMHNQFNVCAKFSHERSLFNMSMS